MAESKKVRIGVMGAFRGKSMINLLTIYREAELVAICDKFVPALNQVRKLVEDAGLNVTFYTDFDEFIQHDMDAVILANYANEHATFAIRCMNAGKHVMSEVLPCETMAQAVELIETVERTGKIYAYAENYCYSAPLFEMWRRYKEGAIGDVIYAEGEYIHDCSAIWPQITYGDRNHWRNRMFPTFYCTHSLGPLFAMTRRRPVQVVGFETAMNPFNLEKAGIENGAGIEMVTLDNGGIFRSVHGDLKRGAGRYRLFCEKGVLDNEGGVDYYVETDKTCAGQREKYTPKAFLRPDLAEKITGHGGGDLYSTYCFVQKILGMPDGQWSIDVYTAVDMGICGILAWKSALNGNIPIKVPDLRDPAQRDQYRNDRACTNPAVAGDQLLPKTTHTDAEIPDAIYDRMRELWEAGLDSNGDPDTHYHNKPVW